MLYLLAPNVGELKARQIRDVIEYGSTAWLHSFLFKNVVFPAQIGYS